MTSIPKTLSCAPPNSEASIEVMSCSENLGVEGNAPCADGAATEAAPAHNVDHAPSSTLDGPACGGSGIPAPRSTTSVTVVASTKTFPGGEAFAKELLSPDDTEATIGIDADDGRDEAGVDGFGFVFYEPVEDSSSVRGEGTTNSSGSPMPTGASPCETVAPDRPPCLSIEGKDRAGRRYVDLSCSSRTDEWRRRLPHAGGEPGESSDVSSDIRRQSLVEDLVRNSDTECWNAVGAVAHPHGGAQPPVLDSSLNSQLFLMVRPRRHAANFAFLNGIGRERTDSVDRSPRVLVDAGTPMVRAGSGTSMPSAESPAAIPQVPTTVRCARPLRSFSGNLDTIGTTVDPLLKGLIGLRSGASSPTLLSPPSSVDLVHAPITGLRAKLLGGAFAEEEDETAESSEVRAAQNLQLKEFYTKVVRQYRGSAIDSKLPAKEAEQRPCVATLYGGGAGTADARREEDAEKCHSVPCVSPSPLHVLKTEEDANRSGAVSAKKAERQRKKVMFAVKEEKMPPLKRAFLIKTLVAQHAARSSADLPSPPLAPESGCGVDAASIEAPQETTSSSMRSSHSLPLTNCGIHDKTVTSTGVASSYHDAPVEMLLASEDGTSAAAVPLDSSKMLGSVVGTSNDKLHRSIPEIGHACVGNSDEPGSSANLSPLTQQSSPSKGEQGLSRVSNARTLRTDTAASLPPQPKRRRCSGVKKAKREPCQLSIVPLMVAGGSSQEVDATVASSSASPAADSTCSSNADADEVDGPTRTSPPAANQGERRPKETLPVFQYYPFGDAGAENTCVSEMHSGWLVNPHHGIADGGASLRSSRVSATSPVLRHPCAAQGAAEANGAPSTPSPSAQGLTEDIVVEMDTSPRKAGDLQLKNDLREYTKSTPPATTEPESPSLLPPLGRISGGPPELPVTRRADIRGTSSVTRTSYRAQDAPLLLLPALTPNKSSSAHNSAACHGDRPL